MQLTHEEHFDGTYRTPPAPIRTRGTMLREDGYIFCSVEPEPKPSHPVLIRAHLIPPLQLESRTFIL